MLWLFVYRSVAVDSPHVFTGLCLKANAIISPGLIKLFGEGGTPKPFVMNGELKSSISLLRIIPVDLDKTLEPNLQRDNNFF